MQQMSQLLFKATPQLLVPWFSRLLGQSIRQLTRIGKSVTQKVKTTLSNRLSVNQTPVSQNSDGRSVSNLPHLASRSIGQSVIFRTKSQLNSQTLTVNKTRPTEHPLHQHCFRYLLQPQETSVSGLFSIMWFLYFQAHHITRHPST